MIQNAWQRSACVWSYLSTFADFLQAIDWAASKGVDIISISAGFVHYQDEVFRAIKAARKINMELLIFAAASNYGNQHDGVAYPAKHHEHVFCIFSCSGNLKQTDDTNPNPTETDNFAMLGEDVRVFPGQVLNGSSIATALAAGFAARIIDFTRHEDICSRLKRKGLEPDRLSTREGVRAVFREISTTSGKFRCIAPWKLWEHGTKDPAREYPGRQHVYKVLKGILKKPSE